MPSYSADVIFDYPDAHGRLEKLGYAYTWEFKPLRQETLPGEKGFVPIWQCEGTEIIPGINALGLLGTPEVDDMSLDDWNIESGAWRLESPSAWRSAFWLCFLGDTIDGQIISKDPWPADLVIAILELVPPPQWTDEAYTALEFNPGVPEFNYLIRFPLSGGYIELFRGTSTHPIDRFDCSEGINIGGGNEVWRALRLRWIDDLMIAQFAINGQGLSRPWITRPVKGWQILTGKIRVRFRGHAGMIAFYPLAYPDEGYAKALNYINLSIDHNRDVPDYVIAKHADGLASVSSTIDDSDGEYKIWPTITISKDNQGGLPYIFAFHQIHEPLFADPRSVPISTEERDTPELITVSWTRELYRGYQCRLVLRDPDKYWREYLQPNMVFELIVRIDGHEYSIMKAYIKDRRPLLDPDNELGIVPRIEVWGHDWTLARGAYQYCLEKPSPLGWDLGEWASYVLRTAGYPHSPSFPSGTIVTPTRWHELEWEWDEFEPLIPAMDRIFQAFQWSPLSIDSDGILHAEPYPGYSGKPDFVLDENTATGEDRITTIELECGRDDFRNAIVLEDVEGDRARSIFWDSLRTPTNKYFIGDLRWYLEKVQGRYTEEDLAKLADTRRKEKLKNATILRWSRPLKPDLKPGHFVEVRMPRLGLPEGTIMRIISEGGELDFGRAWGESTFTCELIENED